MSDEFRPFADDELDPAGAALLRAARSDRPTRASRNRALLALGLGATAASTATIAGAAKAASWPVGKWLVVAAVAATAAGTTTAIVTQRRSPTSPPPSHAMPTVVAAPSPPTNVEVAAPPAAPAPPVPHKIVTPAARSARAGGDDSPSLREEIQSLDGVRADLRHDRLAQAARSLDEHARRFGARGALIPEAEVLRIELLGALGHHAEAGRAARAFLARHPGSPLTPRVRTLARDLR